jgi:hypothetical protein
VPAALYLSQVLGIHPWDAMGNLVECLDSSFAGLADSVTKLA